MVLIAYSHGPPTLVSSGPLAAPTPASACWGQAVLAQQSRLTLPPFRLGKVQPPSDLEPHAVFERFSAALPPLDASPGSEWACSSVLVPLSSLQGPADRLKLQPELVQLAAEEPQGAMPDFLLPRRRMPHTDSWLRQANAVADVPWLPTTAPSEDQQEDQVRWAIALPALLALLIVRSIFKDSWPAGCRH